MSENRSARRRPQWAGARIARWSLALVLVAAAARAQTASSDPPRRAQAEQPREAERPTWLGVPDSWIGPLKQAFSKDPGRPGWTVNFAGLPAGAGARAGVGYRVPLTARRDLEIRTAISSRNFKYVGAAISARQIRQPGFTWTGEVGWVDAPSIAFYGLGNDSAREDRAFFGMRTLTLGATGTLHVTRRIAVGAGAQSLNFSTGPIDAPALTVSSLPGVASGPRYLRTEAFVEADWREVSDRLGRGGRYRASLSANHGLGGGSQSFVRWDGEAVHYVPIQRGRSVFVAKAFVSATQAGEGQEVPYFLLPSLGGGTTLRGFSHYRFRGRHSVAFAGEYWWTATELIDMAVFADAGKVTASAGDLLRTAGLHTSYGLAARLRAGGQGVAQVALARSQEGTRFLLLFGSDF